MKTILIKLSGKTLYNKADYWYLIKGWFRHWLNPLNVYSALGVLYSQYSLLKIYGFHITLLLDKVFEVNMMVGKR